MAAPRDKERRRWRRQERNREHHLWKVSLLGDFVAARGWKGLCKDTVVPPGVKLFSWVRTRRVDYKSGRIPHWLVEACESIPGFATAPSIRTLRPTWPPSRAGGPG